MPLKPTPPLSWLRSFEAAGRLLSFKLAAAELCVSPSTISHQIRDLESYLGAPLFVRGKQLALTEEGKNYLSPVESGFELIRSAETSVYADDRLRVGAFPFLANEILTPHMSDLKAKVSGHISLYTDTDLQSLLGYTRDKRLDVLIRYGMNDKFPGFIGDKLSDIKMVPILSGSETETSIDAILLQPRIKVLGPFDGWALWSEEFSLSPTGPVVLETDSFHAAALAVERGEGICLGILPYLQPWINQRRIRALHEFELKVDQSAYLVYAPHNRDNPAIANLRSWLQEYLLH